MKTTNLQLVFPSTSIKSDNTAKAGARVEDIEPVVSSRISDNQALEKTKGRTGYTHHWKLSDNKYLKLARSRSNINNRQQPTKFFHI